MGALSEVPVGRLGAAVVREAVARSSLAPEAVDEAVMGCVLDAGAGQGVGRQAAVWGGLPYSTPAYSVNKVCGSGMQALILAAQAIRAGDAQVVVAGGMENMSAAPYLVRSARRGLRMGDASLADSMVLDGLTDAFNGVHMGMTAELLAEKYSISRREQDEFACQSHEKAMDAIRSGRFCDEIVPVEVPQKKVGAQSTRAPSLWFQVDEHPRPDTSLESLAHLAPAFKPGGTVTAGNASGISDGAAALVVMSLQKARELGLPPLARLRGWGVGAVDPLVMGLGPLPAARRALDKAGLTRQDIDLFEDNEAFAAQAIAVQRELEIPDERLNVNGGAIALGHPIGASGARIVVTLLYEMRRRGAALGLATLCIGGGMGTALVLELM
ncbi:MAG: acetyl-CoA C-acetyltransferase [Chloroflexi bacterium]|nr:acetyl-CoA C-acetyltransferase [Chloroflexota bacterium]